MNRELPDSYTMADRYLWDALLVLERRAGVKPGEPFVTTRVALIVESGLRGMTVDCVLYKLDRDGLIRKDGRRGAGTTIELPLSRRDR
jgi:hypothetical protein